MAINPSQSPTSSKTGVWSKIKNSFKSGISSIKIFFTNIWNKLFHYNKGKNTINETKIERVSSVSPFTSQMTDSRVVAIQQVPGSYEYITGSSK